MDEVLEPRSLLEASEKLIGKAMAIIKVSPTMRREEKGLIAELDEFSPVFHLFAAPSLAQLEEVSLPQAIQTFAD